MLGPAKNPRFRAATPDAPGRGEATDRVVASPEPGRERRRGGDRRDPNRRGEYQGVERRKGPRRTGELERPAWQRVVGLALAVALGVAAGLTLGAMRDPPGPTVAVRDAITPAVDPTLLAGVQRIRDEAEALTPAAVAIDERAHELWLTRVPDIELALADPDTPAAIRAELAATMTALERVGVLAR